MHANPEHDSLGLGDLDKDQQKNCQGCGQDHDFVHHGGQAREDENKAEQI